MHTMRVVCGSLLSPAKQGCSCAPRVVPESRSSQYCATHPVPPRCTNPCITTFIFSECYRLNTLLTFQRYRVPNSFSLVRTMLIRSKVSQERVAVFNHMRVSSSDRFPYLRHNCHMKHATFHERLMLASYITVCRRHIYQLERVELSLRGASCETTHRFYDPDMEGWEAAL